MAGTVAVCHFHARQRKDHFACLAAVQPVTQQRNGKRFLSLAVLPVSPPACRPARPPEHSRPFLYLWQREGKKYGDRRGKTARGHVAVLHMAARFQWILAPADSRAA